jgi:diguanylate cyclase (GGDEF)-like protein
MRILLVEDDESIVDVLTTILVEQHYVVDVAVDGEAGWELVESFPYDLILLDIMLPKLDGISFCRRLRERNNSVLVMMLTVRDNTTDKLLGLNSGADDYVVKPFDIQELVARIRALLRRGTTTTSSVLVCGDLRLDPDIRTVTYAGHPLQFSRKEYLLLELLLRNPSRVFSRSAIVEHLWSFDEEAPIEDTIKSHIKNIRQELRTVNADDLIETLYGQGYRINPIYLSKATSVETSADSSQHPLDDTVSQIWQRKKGVSLERLAFLEQIVARLKTSPPLDADSRERAIQTAHKLAGSLGTFGLDEGSQLARQIEGLLQSPAEAALLLSDRQQRDATAELERLVLALRQEIEGSSRQTGQSTTWPTVRSTVSRPTPATVLGRAQPLLLVVHQDADLADSLALEAVTWNIQVVIALNLSEAQAQWQRQLPSLILLDLSLIDTSEQASAFLAVLTDAAIPIAIFAAQEHLSARLTAVELGAKLFLPTTLASSQVLHAVAKLLHELNVRTANVLILDADPQTASTLRASLDLRTIRLTELHDPTQLWEILKTVHPDLLILNMRLADQDGLALCQSVRQDFQWNWLPILVLLEQSTVADQPEILQQLYAAGVDDYAIKPIVPPLLSVQIINRLRRSRLLRSQAETDMLTDLASRQQSTQALNQLLQLAHRSQQAVCLATLDLDHFKQINDRFGHVQGDRVLRQFAQFLKQKFRSEDVVARWGGEEFVIGMYGLTREDGVERLAEILEEWRSLSLSSSSNAPLYVSFSAGVAQYPIDGVNLQMLYRAADAALYRAKVGGRDRVLSTKWQPLSSVFQVDVVLIYPKSEFAQSILRALETRGYHTHWIQSGRDALNQFRARNSKLKASVILLSDNLPDQSDLSLLRELGSKRLRQSRVILLLSQPNLKGQARSSHIFDYLLIPCNLSVIMQRVRQAMEQEPPPEP